MQILYDLGSPNPKAFARRWPLEDVLDGLNEVHMAMADGQDIKNPAGMLWRILEEREQVHKKLTDGGN